VVWDIVKENGTLYCGSYSGNYSIVGDHQDMGQLSLFFNRYSEENHNYLGSMGDTFRFHSNIKY
jgi:hypothetical protein